MAKREKIMYEAGYKKHAKQLHPDTLKKLEKIFATEGYQVTDGYVHKEGQVERGSQELEFLEIRFYLGEKK